MIVVRFQDQRLVETYQPSLPITAVCLTTLNVLMTVVVFVVKSMTDNLASLLQVSLAQYTPPTPTRLNSTVASRRRRRCVLSIRNVQSIITPSAALVACSSTNSPQAGDQQLLSRYGLLTPRLISVNSAMTIYQSQLYDRLTNCTADDAIRCYTFTREIKTETIV